MNCNALNIGRLGRRQKVLIDSVFAFTERAPRVDPQQTFELATPITSTKLNLPVRKPERDYTHNEILYTLAMLGQSAGFSFHVGKKEQSDERGGTAVKRLSQIQLHRSVVIESATSAIFAI